MVMWQAVHVQGVSPSASIASVVTEVATLADPRDAKEIASLPLPPPSPTLPLPLPFSFPLPLPMPLPFAPLPPWPGAIPGRFCPIRRSAGLKPPFLPLSPLPQLAPVSVEFGQGNGGGVDADWTALCAVASSGVGAAR
eukprot:CAMPEP_0174736688 /NCGR_PEP_ID=MMETSP1094-20130205/67128_1 /TAXON_ID=156173 /ORGANISM="Chrysochromulina brevifilum, Strain UTEX LB 985" /LENGTH=137 /DNA_ID=CAMNT_0015939833 /DNA_START=202 /DNA_END=615 /DNA_ORIENTATION=+